MHDDSSAPTTKRGSKRARVDATAEKAAAESAAPPSPANPDAAKGGRERLAAAMAATAASVSGTNLAKPVEPEEPFSPPPKRRKSDSAPKPVWIERSPQPRRMSTVLQVGAIVAALGLGWGLGSRGPAPAPAATPDSVQALADEVLRLQGDLRSLKGGVEAVKEGLDRGRQDTAARLQHWGERLDAVQPDQETGARLASLVQRVERIEASDRDPGARLAQLGERLDRAEKQLATRVAAPATPIAPAPAPEQTGSVAEARPAVKPTLDRWALRDVYNGLALIEGQSGGLVEVSPGQTVSGAGRVEAIERRGKAWVVVTSRGVITAQQW